MVSLITALTIQARDITVLGVSVGSKWGWETRFSDDLSHPPCLTYSAEFSTEEAAVSHGEGLIKHIKNANLSATENKAQS